MSDKSSESPPERLKQALAQHRRALEELESALLEYEEALEGKVLDRPDSGDFELLSIAQVCQRLDMGKSWVYRRIHEGEIPSVKLGRTIKIRRSELEDYLEQHRYQPSNGARDRSPSPPEPSPTKS
jgi:excisionase family DNA binding protein